MLIYEDLLTLKTLHFSDKSKAYLYETQNSEQGTWTYLNIHEGELDIIFINSAGTPLKKYWLNQDHNHLLIPPAVSYRIHPKTRQFKGQFKLCCKPHHYFVKQYGLNNVHQEVLYLHNTYLPKHERLNVLDAGCGSGRNSLFLALFGHQVTALDIKDTAIEGMRQIARQENMANVDPREYDLNQPLNLKSRVYDLVLITVTLQFLKPERAPELLAELQQATTNQGMHFIVCPIRCESLPLPDSFSYLPESGQLDQIYRDAGWSIIEYEETIGKLWRRDETGKPIQGLFGSLLAQKID